IEERDHDRHVGAADGQHGQDTEHQRQRYDDEQDGVGSRRVDDEHDAEDDGSTDDRGIHQLLGGEEYRFACYALGELEPCQYRPADGDAADQDGEEDRDGSDGVGIGVDQVLDPADQQRREAAGAVEQSHRLRHLGHLYAPRQYRTDGAAYEYAYQDPHVIDAAVDQGRDDRDEHGEGRDEVAPTRRVCSPQQLEARDEQDRSEDVRELDDYIHALNPSWSRL